MTLAQPIRVHTLTTNFSVEQLRVPSCLEWAIRRNWPPSTCGRVLATVFAILFWPGPGRPNTEQLPHRRPMFWEDNQHRPLLRLLAPGSCAIDASLLPSKSMTSTLLDRRCRTTCHCIQSRRLQLGSASQKGRNKTSWHF